MEENLRLVIESIKNSPEALEKMKNYTWLHKKTFRKDFREYLPDIICWPVVETRHLKKFIKEMQEENK